MFVQSRWHPSLRLRIVAPAALVAIPAIALLLYMSFDRRHQAERAVTESAQRLAGLKTVDLERLVEGTRQLLIAVSQSRDVRHGDAEACSTYLRELISRFGTMYANVGVLDRHGALICSGVASNTVNLGDRNYFKRAIETRTFVVGEYNIGRQTGKASLPFGYPLLDDAGNVRFVVFAAVDLASFREGLEEDADWPADASLIVTDRDHTILALHPHGASWIGKSLKADPVTLLIGPAEPTTVDFEEQGETQVFAFERVRPLDSGLGVRVFLSKTAARDAASWQIYQGLLGFSVVAALVILGVRAASDRLLMRPIADLTDASRRLAAGDLGARAGSSTSIPELNELGKDFDRMAGAIEEREGARLLAEMERKHLEQQYHQAQKMDAVGQLAGGIAHDFNNMLTAILGYCELLLEDPDLGETQRRDLREIEKAGKTAAQLTRRLLAFSRREMVEPVVLDANDVVRGMDNMLNRLLGEQITVTTRLEPALHHVKADRSQLEQVLLNLAMNARAAMPNGGQMVIETANVHLPEGLASPYLAVPPGHYVMIAVRDEGGGMTPDVLQHLFEPFFTTKHTGKGTGLGLATVYGVVKQGSGGITVESEVERGSVFRIYLPRSDEQPASPATLAVFDRHTTGTATVLVVEDDAGIRELTAKMLRRRGHEVLSAADGDQARDICERYGGSIDVLLSDIVMPGMNGPAVAAMLTRIRPEMKVVFMSGYTDDAAVRHGIMNQDIPFLRKPFTPEELASKILEVLG
jgi:signal transduction histidine kinase